MNFSMTLVWITNPTDGNNQEFSLNNETPIFKFRTTASVNNQENQAQIMGNQIPQTHNTSQFILKDTIMNQAVSPIPNHQEEEKKIENENLPYAESMKHLKVH